MPPSNHQHRGANSVRFKASEARSIDRTLLIDADDTLWENNVFYLRCTAHFLDFMASLGYERDLTNQTMDICEQEAVSIHGYGPTSFIEALGRTCEKLLHESGCDPEPEFVAQARSLGEPVASAPLILRPEVEETLRALRLSSQLILVTKGDEAIQQRKIDLSGLGGFFDAQYIVPEKDAQTYLRIVAEEGLDSKSTWMVGNSPKSDINPAVEAGLGAIFIPCDLTWGAELQELADPFSVITLQCFADLLPLFEIEPLVALGGLSHPIEPD
jgi:putative hydrolase of the HAD superfamily